MAHMLTGTAIEPSATVTGLPQEKAMILHTREQTPKGSRGLTTSALHRMVRLAIPIVRDIPPPMAH